MKDYFRAVTLGAFTWKNKKRIALLLASVRKAGGLWLVVHFLLVSICLGFPVTFSIARLDPFVLYGRIYGEGFIYEVPEYTDSETPLAGEEDFNVFMIESGYGTNVLLPILATTFGLILVIQAAFYLFAGFFLGLSRMNASPLSFFERLGLAVFSSTLPALAAALMGMALPAVHILVFYFIVMFFIFQRSRIDAETSPETFETGVAR